MDVPSPGLFMYWLCAAIFGLPLILFYLNRTRQSQQARGEKLLVPPPTKIVEIRLYPIKSCRGFKVKEAILLKSGLDLDRQWMFVDAEKGNFVTIRQVSKMTLIDTAITENDELAVSIRNSNPPISFTIPARPSREWLKNNTTLADVEIWGTKLDGYMYSEELTAPFSEFLGREVRLVYKGPKVRTLRGNGAPKILGRTESMKFADLMPLQISNQKSIEELNGRLSQIGHEEISIERFRPNIVVEGESPWYEDTWKTVKIGGKAKSIISDVVARCARCQVPNVDPETAVKDKNQPFVILWVVTTTSFC